MKSLVNFINESKEITMDLAKSIVSKVIKDNKVNTEDIIKEFEKYDYDMDVISSLLNSSKANNVKAIGELLELIWDYLEDNYSTESTSYNEYIVNNLYKFI